MGDLRGHFRPEFLNRVDEIVLFKPLTLEEIERIVELQVEDVGRRLAQRQMTVDMTEAALRFIAREGYDPVYGARPLRRFVQREVETRIARRLIAGDLRDGAKICIDADGDELVVTYASPETEERTADGSGDREQSGRRMTEPGRPNVRADDRRRGGAGRVRHARPARRPGLPEELGRELADELAPLLAERVTDAVDWSVPVLTDPVAGDPTAARPR